MSSNKPFPQPESYPAAFFTVVAKGAGVLYAKDLPWTPIVAAKRFRQLITHLRMDPTHTLYINAKGMRWSVRPMTVALIITGKPAGRGEPPSPSGFLLDAALGLRESAEDEDVQ